MGDAAIFTLAGKRGDNFVPAPAGLCLALIVRGTAVRHLGPVIGYALFAGAGHTEAVYASADGLSRALDAAAIAKERGATLAVVCA